ncbi:TadA family conjugal transfer-associated ATPase [Actinomyces qiguomingii]|uniref:TadA family conjugal transfer-associated ATPase n=1 Tax=Actinomyces qiguomingii TaxID=2057800 RepID=UPI000CA06B1C
MRGALARGASLDAALGSGASPTTGAGGLARLTRHVQADVSGAGPVLQPLLELDGVTDVLVGAGRTWIDRGRGLEPVADATLPEPEVRALAVRMAAACGRRLDDASPIVDVTLPDGTRLNAVLPPLSADGTLICLRTKRRHAFTIAELVDVGTIAPGLDAVLGELVAGRANCLVTGATGTGKTTLLAALLGLVPADERIVCIEEASELRPDHPHVIHLQERGDNVQGVGAVPMTTLVRTALRMRPDRIVLGECRGPEVRDVLTALNTGHEGGWATLHANSPGDVPARLTALGALAGMGQGAVVAQAVSALDAVVHLRRQTRLGATALRRVTAVAVLERDGEQMRCRDALVLADDGKIHPGPGVDRLAQRIGDAPVASALGADTNAERPDPPREGADEALGVTTAGARSHVRADRRRSRP